MRTPRGRRGTCRILARSIELPEKCTRFDRVSRRSDGLLTISAPRLHLTGSGAAYNGGGSRPKCDGHFVPTSQPGVQFTAPGLAFMFRDGVLALELGLQGRRDDSRVRSASEIRGRLTEGGHGGGQAGAWVGNGSADGAVRGPEGVRARVAVARACSALLGRGEKGGVPAVPRRDSSPHRTVPLPS